MICELLSVFTTYGYNPKLNPATANKFSPELCDIIEPKEEDYFDVDVRIPTGQVGHPKINCGF